MSERRRIMMSGKSAKDFSTEYLTFRALEDTTFALSTNDVYYSLDNGTTWTLLTAGTSTPTILAGHTIKWKGELTPATASGIGTFSSTGIFDATGNVMSLLYGDNFEGEDDLTGKTWCFGYLFSNSKIANARNLILPAMTLSADCYRYMFFNCWSLVGPPQLPAYTLPEECYADMFRGCTSLVYAPNRVGYLGVGQYSCLRMFLGCTSLTQAPLLPSTNVHRYSYSRMFEGCTSLTIAPVLPAKKLSYRSYENMFNGCTSLSYLDAQFLYYNDGTDSNGNWLAGISTTGIFVKSSYSDIEDSFYRVPENWTIVVRNPNIVQMPQGYTQVEYIASTQNGAQWINLNLQMWNNAPISYEVDMQVNLVGKGADNNNQCVLLGANEEVSPYNGFVIRKTSNANKVEQDKNPQVSNYGNTNTMIWIRQVQRNLEVPTHNRTTTLFCGLDSSSVPFRFSESRIYYCRIKSNSDKYVRNLIPCIRNSDNKAGLYDLVNNVFYTNSGSGDDFIYNPLSNNN